MVIRGKKIISVVLSLGLALSFSGCGQGAQAVSGEIPELLEPVGVAQNYEEAAVRTLYDATVYSAMVCPEVKEYEAERSMSFEEYDAFPGETVKKGQRLLHGNTEAIDKSIENMEKKIADMEESYQEFLTEKNKELSEARGSKTENGRIVESIEENEPEKYQVNAETGERTVTPEYAQWEQQYARYSGLYHIADQSVMELEEAIKERTELYELDRKYNLAQLEYLRQDKKELTLTTTAGGVVSAVQYYLNGDWISTGQSIVSVCEPEKKQLRCEYISRSTVTKAEDVYALVDGKRYEVEYQVLETEEYQRLQEQNGAVYSTFYVETGEEEISQGSYAVIVIVKKTAKDVLTVPKDAISRDDTSSYVYVLQNEEAVAMPVKTGMSDGIYTEILSGLSAGDKILTESAVTVTDNTTVIKPGEIGHEFSGTGYLYYPSTEVVKNDLTYGTVYYTERLVRQYQQVQKGEVLARVRVVADEVELERNERKLQREQERLNVFMAEQAKLAESERDEKAIKAKEETIRELEELITDMKNDFAVTEIRSPISGIVTEVVSFETEDLVQPGARLFQVADETRSYIIVEDQNGQLAFGNQATITYKGHEGQDKTGHGEVVTQNKMAVSATIPSDYALIQVSPEDIGEMAGSSQEFDGWWNRSRFKVTVQIRSMRGVLLVPKKAVKEKNGCTYVKVKNQDGKAFYQSFIAGGSDLSNYWVVEGLSEGMEICLE